MALPEFSEVTGDLPAGVHQASLSEVVERFGAPHGQRAVCTLRLTHIHGLATSTGHLLRFVVFGSYVTTKPAPNDVDIILVMDDEFRLDALPLELQGLFDHSLAQARYGASVFWVRPGTTLGESVDDFLAYWQTKRDRTRRGIVEIVG